METHGKERRVRHLSIEPFDPDKEVSIRAKRTKVPSGTEAETDDSFIDLIDDLAAEYASPLPSVAVPTYFVSVLVAIGVTVLLYGVFTGVDAIQYANSTDPLGQAVFNVKVLQGTASAGIGLATLTVSVILSLLTSIRMELAMSRRVMAAMLELHWNPEPYK